MTSTGEEIEEDCANDENDEQEHSINTNVQRNLDVEHENLHLPEFAGRIPQRKKKKLDHPSNASSSFSSSSTLNSRNDDKVNN